MKRPMTTLEMPPMLRGEVWWIESGTEKMAKLTEAEQAVDICRNDTMKIFEVNIGITR